jgi:hypothetical protein
VVRKIETEKSFWSSRDTDELPQDETADPSELSTSQARERFNELESFGQPIYARYDPGQAQAYRQIMLRREIEAAGPKLDKQPDAGAHIVKNEGVSGRCPCLYGTLTLRR